MAIRIVEGVPGTGKSYYCVKHLRDTYYTKDSMGVWSQNEFYATDEEGNIKIDSDGKKIKQKLIISTNLEGLKLPHVSLLDEVRAAGGVQIFFSHAYQEKIEKEDERRIYVIDEAQQIFRRKLSGDYSDVFFYFEKHRHFGHDIYLLTQNAKKINDEIATLAEYHIRAKPRVRSMFGEFPYHVISDGEILKRFSYKPDQEVFALYKSRRKAETEKIKNPVMATVLKVTALTVILGLGGFYGMQYLMKKDLHQEEIKKDITISEGGEKKVKLSEKKEIKPIEKIYPVGLVTQYENKRPVTYMFLFDKYFTDKDIPFETIRHGRNVYVKISDEQMELYFPGKIPQKQTTLEPNQSNKINISKS